MFRRSFGLAAILLGSLVFALGCAKQWDRPQPVEVNSTDAFFPRVGFCPDGSAIATWIEQSDGDDHVVVSHFDPTAGRWENERVLGGDAYIAGTSPELVVDSEGNAIVIWEGWGNNDYDILAARFDSSSGTWSESAAIETGAGGANSPQMAVDGEGNAIAVWKQYDGTTRSIFANRYNRAAGQWEREQLLETQSGLAAAPHVAMNSLGDAMAVWEQREETAYSIYASRYDSVLGVWGPSEKIESGSIDAVLPRVVMQEDGGAVALWAQTYIFFNKFNASSGQWGVEGSLSSGEHGADHPQIAADPAGTLHTVWRQFDDHSIDHYASRLENGSEAWSPPERIEDVNAPIWDHARIAADPSGNAMVVWEEGNDIYAVYYKKALRTWSPCERLDLLDGVAQSPGVAFSPKGDAMAVWSQEDDGFTQSIYFSRFH